MTTRPSCITRPLRRASGAFTHHALSPDTAIESWAPTRAARLDIEVLEWIASQTRAKFQGNPKVMKLFATIIGATRLPLAQLPNLFDMGM
jgi:hypothetical protein